MVMIKSNNGNVLFPRALNEADLGELPLHLSTVDHY